MGMSSNPVAHVATNVSNVIGSNDNDSRSDRDSLPGIIFPFSALCAVMTPVRGTASPLHVPHLCILALLDEQQRPGISNLI
jgi:hypothetical protein